jgi:hypothetical protein
MGVEYGILREGEYLQVCELTKQKGRLRERSKSKKEDKE